MGASEQPFAKNHRDRVIAFLLFLTSEECSGAFRKFVSPEKTAYELCRLWFDEIYAPGIRYLHSLKGDYSKENAAKFQECFTEEEFAALERFHRFFELRMDMLPQKHFQRRAIPQNDTWRNIVKDARHLLKALEPDWESKQQKLEGQIQKELERFGNNIEAPDPGKFMILENE